MNARLYDAKLHRFLASDNFIQDSGNSQSYNRYGYVLNNPLRFTDPSGEIAFVPILLGMAYGAIIGAATSAVIYSATALITQDWNIKSFGKSVLFDAVGGGFGAVGGQIGSFGQSIGYNILSNMASNAATNLAFGNEITIGNLVGAAVGGFVSSQIGNFNGVKGNDFENIAAEIGFNSTRGALTGSTEGAIGAIIDGKNVKDGIIQGAMYGAISGGTLSVTNILLMGPAYLPEREYGNFRNDRPVYRKGHFLWLKSTGISFGRNLVTRLTGDLKFDEYLHAHETGHFIQQRKLGFANFYGKIFGEYMREGFNESYDISGTLEFDANLHSLKMNGYFWSNKYQYINNSNYEYFY